VPGSRTLAVVVGRDARYQWREYRYSGSLRREKRRTNTPTGRVSRLVVTLGQVTNFRAEDRTDPPTASNEAATLLGFLNYHRDTLRWKCSGLTTAQLSTPMAPTTLTLGGLLKHMAVVEAGWLNQLFGGGVAKPSWLDELDQEDPDWSLTSAAGAAPEQLFAWLDESIEVSDLVMADALARPDGLDALSVGEEDGKRISLRWIVCHLIEEYARHNGHADLLRQSIDGATGD
jgi:uncharacterized damage-inducible protein DinB